MSVQKQEFRRAQEHSFLPFISMAEPFTPKPKVWLATNRIAVSDIAIIVAEAKTGKSVLAAGLAVAVAHGLPWFGSEVTKGAVLYLALERFQATAANIHAALTVVGINRANIDITGHQFNLAHAEANRDAEAIIALASEAAERLGEPIRLIVIDTYSCLIAGYDENSAMVASAVAARLRKIIAATGATIVILHHPNSSGSARGSGALEAAADVIISVKGLNGSRAVRIERGNDVVPGSLFKYGVEKHGPGLVAMPEEAMQAGAETVPNRRANEVLARVLDLAVDGRVSRRLLLQEARSKQIIVGKTSNAESTAMARVLALLKHQGKIDFDETAVWLIGYSDPKPTHGAALKRAAHGVGNLGPETTEANKYPTKDATDADCGICERGTDRNQPHNSPHKTRPQSRGDCGMVEAPSSRL